MGGVPPAADSGSFGLVSRADTADLAAGRRRCIVHGRMRGGDAFGGSARHPPEDCPGRQGAPAAARIEGSRVAFPGVHARRDLMKRVFDLLLAACAAVLLAAPIVLIALLVRATSAGPALYWSERVGKNNRTFSMPKFRSMRMGTPAVA